MDVPIAQDLARLARRQDGLLTRGQAAELRSESAIRHALASGRWTRLTPGVYATFSSQAVNGGFDARAAWPMRARAALLHAGEGAALGGTSAAYMWEILRSPPPVIVLVIPHERSVVRIPGVRVRRTRTLEAVEHRGYRCVAAARTVIDLAAEPGTSANSTIAYAADAVRVGCCTAAELTECLHRRRAHPHRRTLLLALGDIDAGTQSLLEHRALQGVFVRHGLPRPEMQVPGPGIRRDFLVRRHGLVLEVDGQIGHLGSRRLADYRRDRAAARDGLVTLRAGWNDVDLDACGLAADVHGTLTSRGYAGALLPCSPRCSATRSISST